MTIRFFIVILFAIINNGAKNIPEHPHPLLFAGMGGHLAMALLCQGERGFRILRYRQTASLPERTWLSPRLFLTLLIISLVQL